MLGLLALPTVCLQSQPFFTHPVYLADYGSPNIVLAGDFDGNGRDGLMVFDPDGKGNLEYRRFSPLGKLCFPLQAANGFVANGIAAVAGDFVNGEKASVAIVTADGTIRLEHGFDSAQGKFTKSDVAGRFDVGFLGPKGGWGAFDFHRYASENDLLICSQSGKMALLTNDGNGHFTSQMVSGRSEPLKRIEVGDFGRTGQSELVEMDSNGEVFEQEIDPGFNLGKRKLLIKVEPGDGLAVGRFTGDKSDDILAGQFLLPGGDVSKRRFLAEIANATIAKDDAYWLAADLGGEGRDDLLRVRRSKETFTPNDIYAQYEPGAAGFCDSSNDGLPDAWKTGTIKPNGLDLKAMGCSPLHKDVIVEVQPMPEVSLQHVHDEMKRVVNYFASIPVQDLDGTKGIAMHVIYREPIAKEDEGKSWQDLGEKYHPADHRGITHWMVVYHGGGGQSDIMYDRGSCGDNAMWCVFTHEFGHQLGLDHNGRYIPDGCPIYPSLMNYPYNYQLNGRRDNVGYSDGKFAGFTLTETHLSKYVPFPPSSLAFVAGPPYHFHLKPAPDGKGTLVDWNWDGDFNEKTVAADINYGYGTTAGLRHTIGKTYTTPAPVSMGLGKHAPLILLWGDLLAGSVGLKQAALHPSLCPAMPGRLRAMFWKGNEADKDGDHWSTPFDVEGAGVAGDPSAAYLDGAAWVAYPTVSGVSVRRVWLDAGAIKTGQPLVLSKPGAQVTLCAVGNRLALFLWLGSNEQVSLQLLRVSGGQAMTDGSETPLGFTSVAPVGAATGASLEGKLTIWLGLNADQDKDRPSRWQIRHFALDGDSLKQLSEEWVGGDKGGERGQSRISLLWEPNRQLGADGQLYLFGCGSWGAASPWSCSYVTMRIAEKDVNGGWLTRRYYDEWTNSRSGPGVCFYGGDIFFASRWFGGGDSSNDNLFVAFSGRGIQPQPMGDYNDIAFIRDYGLHRSIAPVR